MQTRLISTSTADGADRLQASAWHAPAGIGRAGALLDVDATDYGNVNTVIEPPSAV